MAISGQSRGDMMHRVMSPSVPKSEADLSDAIEKWEQALKQLEAMGDGFVMPSEFRLAALQKLMSGSQQSKGAYEQLMMEGKGHEPCRI